MNLNKKLDRMKQWAGEKMGGEIKTNTSDDFKALEIEMDLRSEGMNKLHKSMTAYTKHLGTRSEGLDKEKMLPVGYLGTTMIHHGEDFDPESSYGGCLSSLGRANERIAHIQETYVANATTSWLEGLERSLAQMKDYQAARKKLEQRRLAYDASLAKMQKAKKEDFRVEEELRSQKAKYEETSEDVYRRMQDIKEAETESVQDLSSFLEAELAYYDRCREVLMQLKRDWPAGDPSLSNGRQNHPMRSRSNTAHSYHDRYNPPVEEEPMPDPRITIPKLSSRTNSPRRDMDPPRRDLDNIPMRPAYARSTTYDGQDGNRDSSPAPMPRLSRVPTEPTALLAANRSNLRPVNRAQTNADVFSDNSYDSHDNSSYYDRSDSPTHSIASTASRAASWSTADTPVSGRKAPPPPPPSRAKKPAPPPPPMKRSALSSSEYA